MLTDYFALSFKNVRKRGLRSWLTMLGVFIGIAAVVSLISLGQGLQTAISGQFGALSTNTLTIQGADTGFSPPGSTSVKKMTSHDEELIGSIAGVQMTIPRLLRTAKIEYNDVLGFGYIANLPDDKEQADEVYNSMNIEIEEGRILRTDDNGQILIGNDFVKNELYGKQIKLGSKISIQGKEFKVTGILKRSSTLTLNSAILMTDKDMRDIFEIPNDEIDFIVAKVDESEIEDVAEKIEKKMREARKQKEGEEDFQVQTPTQSLQTVNTILVVINVVVIGIALISLLVGGIGIANTMFTSVLERTREIGIMKSVGAKNSDILLIFLIESGLLGLAGGLIGALIGLSLALLVSYSANTALGQELFQIAFSPAILFGSISFSFLIGIISGLVPAFQASKLNPVEALRK